MSYGRIRTRIRNNCGNPSHAILSDQMIVEHVEQILAGVLLDLDLADTGRRVQTSFTVTPSVRRTSISGHADLSIVQDVVWQYTSTQTPDRWHDLNLANIAEIDDTEDSGVWACAIEGMGDEMYLVLTFDPVQNPVRVQVRYSGGIPEISELRDNPRLAQAFEMLLVHQGTVACLPELVRKPYASKEETEAMKAYVAQRTLYHASEYSTWRERFDVFRFWTGETGPVERTGDPSVMDEGFSWVDM